MINSKSPKFSVKLSMTKTELAVSNLTSYIYCLLLFIAVTACSITKNISNEGRFTHKEMAMIMAGDSLDPMRVYLITIPGDSVVLRTPSSYIKPDAEDPALEYFVKRLYQTVTDSANMGVGIAAPQVGILKNIIWVQRFDKPGFPFEVYLNPVINTYSDEKQIEREGCLSIPNRVDTLSSRAQSIIIEYDKMDGSHHKETVEGFTAVIFQHEIDHLRGILYTDHLEREMGKK